MVWLIGSSFIWAFSFGLIKSEVVSLDPTMLGAVRTAIAALFFLPLFLRKSKYAMPRVTFMRAVVCGFIQIGLMYGPYLTSFKYLKAHEVALFTMTTPVIMAGVSGVLARHLSGRVVIAAILATIGGFIVAGTGTMSSDLWLGFALVQLSNLFFAVGLLLWNRWMPRLERTQSRLMLPFFLGAFLASLILVAWSGLTWQPLTERQWLVCLYLGVVASGLGFFLWNKGALLVSAEVLGAANNLKLPIAVFVSLTVFGESAALGRLVLGTFVILVAIRVASRTSAVSRPF